MDFVYFIANASLCLRIIEYLRTMEHGNAASITVVHQIDGWIVKVRYPNPLAARTREDCRAFLNELGIPYQPDMRLQMVFWSLETGQSSVEVMRRYQVAVVSHGIPDTKDIEAFRKQFTKGLGYCPETLA